MMMTRKATPITMANELLYCAAGHKWARPGGKRGKKPKYCPKHAPAKVEHESEFETLVCKHGDHEFQRKRARGKKPQYCETHQPTADTKVRVTEVRQNPRAAELLAATGTLPEMKRKLAYVEKQLASGRRTASDVTHLLQTQNELVREAERVYS